MAGIIVLGGAEDDRAMDRAELAGLNEAAERYTEVVGSGAAPTRGPDRVLGRLAAHCCGSSRQKPRRPGAPVRGAGRARERITLEAKSRDTLRERDVHARAC